MKEEHRQIVKISANDALALAVKNYDKEQIEFKHTVNGVDYLVLGRKGANDIWAVVHIKEIKG